MRVAKVDDEVLGYRIFNGSSILCSTCGPSYLHDTLALTEGVRSLSSRSARAKKEDDEFFDANAGPSLPFGAGPRSCFGKQLALMEMRIMIILLLSYFKLEKVPEDLSGYGAMDEVTLTRQPLQCFVKPAPRAHVMKRVNEESSTIVFALTEFLPSLLTRPY